MKIWIDADACPRVIKEIVFKVSARLKLQVVLVANSSMSIPHTPYIDFVKVDQGADLADIYIVQHIEVNDLVVTADIPLAAQVVDKKAYAINPRGELYTQENINEHLSVRNFMQELRDNGMSTAGPEPFTPKDSERFTNSLDRTITKLLKK